MEFFEKSYVKHSNSHAATSFQEMEKWTKKDTVDYWRHKRMYDTLLPILSNYKEASWLTVGDGRYGTDANYLLQYSQNVMASDIAIDCLTIAKENNFIKDYKIENAEKISAENNYYDFVLCKEAYHHFPRPAIAVYEMLRVAKKGIVLIEPNDENIITPQTQSFGSAFFWFIQSIKNIMKSFFGKAKYYKQGFYEESGNYVYSISEREIEKMALGLNYDLVAFKGLNDSYIEGVENELVSENGALFKNVKKNIAYLDNLSKKGKKRHGLLTAIIFKEMPDEKCISEMKTAEFKITKLTKNPYI